MENQILQYRPFSSCINPSFWHKFTEIKLDIDKLDDNGKNIIGFFTNFKSVGNFLDVDCTSFNREYNSQTHIYPAHGVIFNKNTIEEFKNCDKSFVLNKAGDILWNNITQGNCLKDPSILNTFIILSFADLKSYKYYYWFAFPALSTPISYLESTYKAEEKFSSEQLKNIYEVYVSLSSREQTYFILCEKNSKFISFTLDASISIDSSDNLKEYFEKYDNIYFCFSDPNNDMNPGWSLRNYIALLVHHCPILYTKTISVLSIRVDINESLQSSLLYSIKLPDNLEKSCGDAENSWVGWERNENGKFGPRLANIANSMDPMRLAESSVDLNLKLMKWRIVPELNLEKIKQMKCLLLGAGTLGCAVARCLLGWGVRHITFVDSGKVSYSNPVRQSLFTNADCLNGGKPKAQTAAERLREIFPGVISVGHNLRIPMPGHTIGPSLLEDAKKDLSQLKDLISKHDCMFLLTDSRESRWLPTLLSTALNKIAITAALGYDSYLVMRHGTNPSCESSVDISDCADTGLKIVSGNKLGCYFCNDVTAPGNSLQDRTLDQQCTVTRPGVSNIASSIAVELLMSITQHPNGHAAPAFYATGSKKSDIQKPLALDSVLGDVPHTLRGYLGSYELITPVVERFEQCIACSERVLNKFKEEGDNFLFQVFESSTYLEKITGLQDLLQGLNNSEMWELSDTDDET
ncbi:ubiquitin-like modifier-activating enzyme ATG7 [Ctenocephalides felis]|uniref:ubiquitin-like modifier-activating enzyme ATG7 n=1 Tax=Ctenocephalides felis TaxID=7515 RepID=UPI000E6E4985|nr:ubiquitin-like modifier-activating enzyme ATG7 [Ctenocephalides felis]